MKIHPEGKIDAKRYPTFEDVLDRLESNKDHCGFVNIVEHTLAT